MSVRFTKWQERPHWRFETRWLGADEFGTWLVGAPGIRLQRADEPPIFEKHGFVQLVPDRGDWIAFFNLSGPFEIYVDVTTTPRWRGGSVTCVDLDLDVVRRPGGGVEVLDEDEFAAHQVELGYPAAVVRQARETADWLIAALSTRREPFDAVGPAWLATQSWGRPAPEAPRNAP